MFLFPSKEIEGGDNVDACDLQRILMERFIFEHFCSAIMPDWSSNSFKIFIFGFMAFLFIFAFFQFNRRDVQSQQYDQKLDYKGYAFMKKEGHWFLEWQRNGNTVFIPFRLSPIEVEDVTVSGGAKPEFLGDPRNLTPDVYEKPIYKTEDVGSRNPKYVVFSQYELRENLYDAFDMQPFIVPACTDSKLRVCSAVPTVTCDSKDKRVIYVKKGGKAEIIFNDNCITVQGENLEMMKAADRLLYIWLGIMD